MPPSKVCVWTQKPDTRKMDIPQGTLHSCTSACESPDNARRRLLLSFWKFCPTCGKTIQLVTLDVQ